MTVRDDDGFGVGARRGRVGRSCAIGFGDSDGSVVNGGVSHGSLEMQWEHAVMDACVGIGAENVLFHRSSSR